MATHSLDGALKSLANALKICQELSLSDGELVERYVNDNDPMAFQALVYRHGPMVLGACRRILQNETEAEDAFQATFLVLVRKAATIRPPGKVSNWLYGVACNTARKAKATGQKRVVKEKEAAQQSVLTAPDQTWEDIKELLDTELYRLPDHYRSAIVLCDLESRTIAEAAQELHCPQGTVASRLRRGRELLAQRLSKYGLSLTAALLTSTFSAGRAQAKLSLTLLSSVLQTVSSASLPPGAQRAPTFSKGLKPMTTARLTLIPLLLILGTVLVTAGDPSSQKPLTGKPPDSQKKKPLMKEEPNELQKLLPPNTILLTEKDQGKTIHAQVGQLIVVCFPYPRPDNLAGFGGTGAGLSAGPCTETVNGGHKRLGKTVTK